jgi:hypothetical protein
MGGLEEVIALQFVQDDQIKPLICREFNPDGLAYRQASHRIVW